MPSDHYSWMVHWIQCRLFIYTNLYGILSTAKCKQHYKPLAKYCVTWMFCSLCMRICVAHEHKIRPFLYRFRTFKSRIGSFSICAEDSTREWIAVCNLSWQGIEQQISIRYSNSQSFTVNNFPSMQCKQCTDAIRNFNPFATFYMIKCECGIATPIKCVVLCANGFLSRSLSHLLKAIAIWMMIEKENNLNINFIYITSFNDEIQTEHFRVYGTTFLVWPPELNGVRCLLFDLNNNDNNDSNGKNIAFNQSKMCYCVHSGNICCSTLMSHSNYHVN